MNKNLSSIETIIARLDNDFNIMSSDYIPRVGAWCIDAMNEIGILQYEEKETTIEVVDRVPIQMNHNEKNEFYLKTKQEKLQHMLNY